MANWKKAAQTNEIDVLVNYIRHLMNGNSGGLQPAHYLGAMLNAHSSWVKLGKPTPIPDDVIILAAHAQALRSYRNDYMDSKIRNVVSKRLCSEDHVQGLLFEFRSCIAFDNIHQSVRWLPNYGNLSESDIRVHHAKGSIFYVECTSKQPKPRRVVDEKTVIADVLKSLRIKSKSCPDPDHPRVVSVFFPEDIDFQRDSFRQKLGEKLLERWNKPQYASVSALVVVSNTPVQLNRQAGEIAHYDTDLVSLSYRNPNATELLPPESINANGI